MLIIVICVYSWLSSLLCLVLIINSLVFSAGYCYSCVQCLLLSLLCLQLFIVTLLFNDLLVSTTSFLPLLVSATSFLPYGLFPQHSIRLVIEI